MIKKLRLKMVITAMISLIAVLFCIIGAATTVSYHGIIKKADYILMMLQENDGSFPDRIFKGKDKEFDAPPPEMEDKQFNTLSPELPYETRFFMTTLTQTGNVVSVNTGKIAAVSTEDATAFAEEIFQSGKVRGFKDDYRYLVYTKNAQIQIIFLDCGRDLRSFRSFVLSSCLTAVAGSLMVLILMILVSSKVVKPYAESYSKQRRFITDAGHELKTPLAIIHADTEVLQMDLGENEWLTDIKAQTDRMAELTNSLVYLSKMEEEQPVLDMLPFSISDMVEETVESFQALAKTNDKNLSAKIMPMLTMTGDEKALRRLLTIFLDNAIKYSNENGDIKVTLTKQKNNLKLEVYNTADKIDKEKLPYLFDRFYRMDSSHNSKTGGYGLGLSIAAAIVKNHHGKIMATSEDGHSLLITTIFSN